MMHFIDALMNRMTLDEKIGQLNLLAPGSNINTGAVVNTDVEQKIRAGLAGGMFGIRSPGAIRQAQQMAVEESRLGIPLIFGSDVIHGHETIFPIPLGLSCTWDMALIEKSARIAATEASADGLNWVFSPMVDIARDPRWGRIAEGAGEDPFLGSRIAEAMIRGYQGNDLAATDTVMACVKHFALYGAAEGGRDYNSVDMSPLLMKEIYLPPFEAAIRAGAASLMTAFNDINGTPATAHKKLIGDILRRDWGFSGLVVSDYTGVNEMTPHGLGPLEKVSALALRAGVDMDMVGEGFLTTLKKSLAKGVVSEVQIDQACRRVLEAKWKLGLFGDPYQYLSEERAAQKIMTAENRQDARDMVARSCVLLKNDHQTLPLPKTGTIALIGPLANDRKNMLGTWAISGDPEKCISVLDGMRNVAGPGVTIHYAKGANIVDDPQMAERLNVFGPIVEIDTRPPEQLIAEALDVAAKSDIIVAVLGEAKEHSGESASRSEIGIPKAQRPLLEALAATGKPVVLLIMSGRPLTLEWENDHVAAMVVGWFGGTESGNGMADVLFGNHNPSGKLTATFPRNVGQIPLYYNHKSTGRPYAGTFKKFTSCYLDVPNEPLFPFGYGLSYTTFDYGPVRLNKTVLRGNEKLTASVTLTNTGRYAGEETVQLYITDPVAKRTRPVRELKGFQKILLQPGEQKTVTFDITPDDLKYHITDRNYNWESGDFVIQIGPHSSATQSANVKWVKSDLKRQDFRP
ncbi:MAG: beta-glucosidase BglX [Micavibrio sp.]